jgi:hypothetical protein
MLSRRVLGATAATVVALATAFGGVAQASHGADDPPGHRHHHHHHHQTSTGAYRR